MNWKKLGRILYIENRNSWMISHSAVPFAVHLENDVYRIYFSVRNSQNQSQGSFIDYDVDKMVEINYLKDSPLISAGDIGLFDDAGVVLSCYCESAGLFYYLGWSLPKAAPFSNQIGAAKLNQDRLEKISRHPILGKCDGEPFSFGYPWVLKTDDKYIMWYDTNLYWNIKDPSDYKFPLKSAISADGINWTKTYHTNIMLDEGERAIDRPCVLCENGKFKMWYSVDRNGVYAMGYAESADGYNWIRLDDEVGISTSEQGWDCDGIEYPFVFNHKSEKYMLYNGNGYGKSGIGLAKLEQY